MWCPPWTRNRMAEGGSRTPLEKANWSRTMLDAAYVVLTGDIALDGEPLAVAGGVRAGTTAFGALCKCYGVMRQEKDRR